MWRCAGADMFAFVSRPIFNVQGRRGKVSGAMAQIIEAVADKQFAH
jgi:hypothetical protein